MSKRRSAVGIGMLDWGAIDTSNPRLVRFRFVLPALIAVAAFFGPRLANAQQCAGNPQTGCSHPRASCSPVTVGDGELGLCVSACPVARECECNCVGSRPAEPEIAFRLVLGMDCPQAPVIDQVRSVVIGILANLGLGDPDVRVQCQAGVLSMLIWSTKSSSEEQARRAAQVPNEISGDLFGAFVTKDLIARLATSGFDKDPRQRVVPGYPSVHLSRLWVTFPPGANTIETHVHGHDDRPTPDVDFTTTITDRLLPRSESSTGPDCSPATDRLCGCNSSTHNDVSLLDEIVAAVTGAIGSSLAFAGHINVLLGIRMDANDLDAFFNRPRNRSQGGAGCVLYQGLPAEIALPETGGIIATERSPRDRGVVAWPPPQRKKLVFHYPGFPQVVDRAVTFHGFPELKPRTPAVQIVGPSVVSIGRHALETSAGYAVVTVPLQSQDFFGQLSAAWSADPKHVQIVDPAKAQTEIFFEGDPNMAPGTRITQTITVRVTDAEGSSATASLSVQVLKSYTDNPPPKPNPPPRCKLHPGLPECQTHPF